MPAKKICAECEKNRLIKQFTSPQGRVCKPCQKEKRTANARRKHLKETYGITQEEYDLMLEAQGGRCYICKGQRNYNLQVDHCHKTGRIRGLLCKMCNKRLLPSVRDSVARLLAAAKYLEQPPAFEVIGERVVPDH